MLTLGTPAMAHIEIDLSAVKARARRPAAGAPAGAPVILRSTVAPGTTEWVAGYLAQRRGFTIGEDVFVSHVPERIAENHFIEEIYSLPSIIGGVGPGSGERAAELFSCFGTEIVHTTPVQAELAKIWTNILRYTEFALPNLLMMNCEQYGANVFEVIELINHDYPRGGMKRPGLTAGTCLRKDFAFSEERSSAPGMLLAVSRVHETMPQFLVQGLKRRMGGSLVNRKVAVLGLAFKRNSDDLRDSLSFKLIRLLERELAHVAQHDPHVPDISEPLESALADADAVIVATNHSEFEELLKTVPGEVLVVDPWNVTGRGRCSRSRTSCSRRASEALRGPHPARPSAASGRPHDPAARWPVDGHREPVAVAVLARVLRVLAELRLEAAHRQRARAVRHPEAREVGVDHDRVAELARGAGRGRSPWRSGSARRRGPPARGRACARTSRAPR